MKFIEKGEESGFPEIHDIVAEFTKKHAIYCQQMQECLICEAIKTAIADKNGDVEWMKRRLPKVEKVANKWRVWLKELDALMGAKA